jgi:hypothetical protein
VILALAFFLRLEQRFLSERSVRNHDGQPAHPP